MFKTMIAFAAVAAFTAPAAAQTAGGALPRCSATVHDSCDQGANDPNAISAEQAMKSGGVGDRGHDDAANMGGSKPMMHKKMMHKKMMHKPMHKMSTTSTTSTTDKPM